MGKKIGLYIFFISSISLVFMSPRAHSLKLGSFCRHLFRAHHEPREAMVITSVPLDALSDAEILLLIRSYRDAGGRSYWRVGKIKSGYASSADLKEQTEDERHLKAVGMTLRLLSEAAPVLSDEIREQIRLALVDYGHLEWPGRIDKVNFGPVAVPTSP